MVGPPSRPAIVATALTSCAVSDVASQQLVFTVTDYDLTSKDDFLGYADTFPELLRSFEQFLIMAVKEGVKLNPAKVKIGQKSNLGV